MGISVQRMWLIQVKGIDGTFQTKTGGEITSETTKNYDGGSKDAEVLSSPAEIDNITVSRAYKYERDYASHAFLRSRVGYWRSTISVQPLNEDMATIGKPTVYPDALLVRLSEPDADSSSGDPSMFELEFAVGSVVQ